MLEAHFVVIGVEFGNVFRGLIREQALRHAHAARSIGHIDHRAFVMRRDLDGSMNAAGRGAANQQGNLFDAEMIVFLHLRRDVLHFFQTRRDQPRQPHDICAFHLRPSQNLMAGHHHAHVHHIKVIALQDHGDDVFANVMHIALDGSDDDLAFGAHISARRLHQLLFFFNIGQQVRHSLLHHAGRLHHLRQKHLALAKEVAHDVHAVHQRAFNHMQRPPAARQNRLVALFGVKRDEIRDAMNQRMRQAAVHVLFAPGQFGGFVLRRALQAFSGRHELLASVC